MSLVCKITRSHTADDRMSCRKLGFESVFWPVCKLCRVYSKFWSSCSHKRPVCSDFIYIISHIDTHICHILRCKWSIACKSCRHHGKAGRSASTHSDILGTIRCISPYFAPLEIYRNMVLDSVIFQIYRLKSLRTEFFLWSCWLFRIINHPLQCFLMIKQPCQQIIGILFSVQNDFLRLRVFLI